MSHYEVILYNVAGDEIQRERFEVQQKARDFLFASQWSDCESGAAAGELLIVTEYPGGSFSSCLALEMWAPVDNEELVARYLQKHPRKGG